MRELSGSNTRTQHSSLRVALAIAAATLSLILAHGITPLAAQAHPAGNTHVMYSCTSHCYGTTNFYLQKAIDGGSTNITVEQMTCTGCENCPLNQYPYCVGFIDNEMWVQNNGATNWVEAGYTTYPSPAREDYFWADNDSNGYYEHDLQGVPAGDYGNSTNFYIDRYTSNEFQVVIESNNYYTSGLSTNNSMTPTNVVIGQEEHNIGTAMAYEAYYTFNAYIDSSQNFHYLTFRGTETHNNPPHEGWITYPSPTGAGSTGGEMWTYS